MSKHSIPIPDESLVERAVRNAGRLSKSGKMVKWAHVADAFAIGSTYASILCRRFGIDPDEQYPNWEDEDDDFEEE